MQKLILLLFFSLIVGCGSSPAAVLVFSPSGTYVTKVDLATAATAADAAGKTVVVTTPQTLTANLVWPSDRGIRFEQGGCIIPNAYSLTGLKETSPEAFSAKGDGSTDDTAALKAAFVSVNGGGRLLGKTGAIYKVAGTISPTGSNITFDGQDATIKNYISNNTPLFDMSAMGTWVTVKNLNVTADVAANKGHTFYVSGTTANTQAWTFDNVHSLNQIGGGNDHAGSAIGAYFLYAYQVQSFTIKNCSYLVGTGGIYIDASFKITINNSVIDRANNYGIYVKNTPDVSISNGTIINGCGDSTGKAGVYFDQMSTFSFINSRIKGGLGNLIRSGDVLSRGVIIEGNQFEHYSPTDSAILIKTSVLTPTISNNVFKFLPDSGTTQTNGIEVADIAGGGMVSHSGTIANNYFYTVGANTLAAAIKLNSTLNSVRSWEVKSNRIGAATGDTVSGVITNGILCVGTGYSNRFTSNTIGGESSGSVTNGIVIPAGYVETYVSDNRAWGTVGTLLSDSGSQTRRFDLGTWTPVVKGKTTAGTITYSTQLGTYRREGGLVYFTCNVALSAISVSPTGFIVVSGLPVSALSIANTFYSVEITNHNLVYGTYTSIGAYVRPGTDEIWFALQKDSTAPGVASSTAITASSTFIISGAYPVN